MTKQDEWQEREVRDHALDPRRAIFASPRLGKTKATIDSKLEASGTSGHLLVNAPLVVCAYWADQLRAAGFSVLCGYEMTVAELKPQLMARLGPTNCALVLNYDKMRPLADALIRWGVDALIADESHYIKNHSAGRTKAVQKVARHAKWVRILTGTPTPNNYGDLWAPMSMLDPRPLPEGWGTWTQFRARHLICDLQYPNRVLGHVNVAELQGRLLRSASLVRREDVFGPDTYQYITRGIVLPAAARARYDRLAKDWITAPDDEVGEVRADHILKRITRLQQLACGYIRDEDGTDHLIHTAKIEAVGADLEAAILAGEKSVVFHKYRWESEKYFAMARELCGKNAFQINGETKGARRAEIVSQFAAAKGGAIVVAQTRSAGIGISLAEATHALIPTESFSFTDESQAIDRILKPGYARTVTRYPVTDSVDEYIRDVIEGKGNIHESSRNADRYEMAFGKMRRTHRKIA